MWQSMKATQRLSVTFTPVIPANWLAYERGVSQKYYKRRPNEKYLGL